MRKITKSDIKNIKAGSHDTLIDAIEFLIDSYDEDKFEAGYKCRIEDEAVVAYKLAEEIMKFSSGRTPKKPFSLDNLTKVIDDYFTNALKDK
jgi:hypothetical protein